MANKNNDKERQFSEDIDRLLAGEEVTGNEDTSEDYRTTINFARKLVELRVDPSPGFKDGLKQQLLLKLTEQEIGATRQKESAFSLWEFLNSLIPRSPVWRTAMVTVFVMAIAIGVLWRTGVFTQSPDLILTQLPEEAGIGGGTLEEGAPRPAEGPGEQAPFELEEILLETPVFVFGEVAEVELVFKNMSSESISVSSYPPTIQIVGSRALGPVRTFAKGDGILRLSPLETISHILAWDQKDSNGEQVSPGWYTLYVGEVTVTTETEPSATQVGFPLSTKFLVQFPQGAMEKVIELDQTQTAGALSITLERVELHNAGIIFSAFVTPPGYKLPQISEGSLLKGLVPALAEYTVDDVTIYAKYSELRALEDGIRMTWGQGESYLEPIPSDATKLVITIISFAEWQGPWQFIIPLQD